MTASTTAAVSIDRNQTKSHPEADPPLPATPHSTLVCDSDTEEATLSIGTLARRTPTSSTDDEASGNAPISNSEIDAKPCPSPYHVFLPLFLQVAALSISIVPQQQWLILYLCRRFSVAAAAHQNYHSLSLFPNSSNTIYLPGMFDNPVAFSSADWSICSSSPDIQILAARWGMVLSLCSSIPSLITGPCFGSLSDIYGRKLILIIPIVGLILNYTSYLVVANFSVGLWVLIATHLLIGMMGSWSMMITAAISYLADTTSTADRSQTFVYAESFALSAGAFGPLLGGYLVKVMPSIDYVFALSVVLGSLALLAVVFLVPESLKRLRETAIPVSNLTPDQDADLEFDVPISVNRPNSSFKSLQGLSHQFEAVSKIRRLFHSTITAFCTSSTHTFVILVSALCIYIAYMSGRLLLFPYASFCFGWDSLIEGQYLMTSIFSRVFHMLVTFPLLTHLFTLSRPKLHESPQETSPLFPTTIAVSADALAKTRFEIRLVSAVFFIGTLSTIAFALAPAGWMFFVIAYFDGIGSIGSPIIRGLISRSSPENAQGQMFSFVQFLENFTSLVMSVVYPSIWTATVGTSAPFLFLLLAAFLYACATVIVAFARAEEVSSVREENIAYVDVCSNTDIEN
ncbi:hypothetical protein BASA50_002288 [Batrachochytrium salamandrivorans]|uniref:Major facilitator superfamily (MFS) profile domain-containing protein n=1 Tax=Batrachochytrium salamandrivorans TaxID=1357716 RepID=A0ABQ8FLS0_9FUNG|nr:hypothetical protein BASA60_009963 [Batrachochytrium salamandrivorans]KAH6565559.1 hypothetical protein BASA62_007192 [Batrachochytrium salamandrivorans]KAH6582383.1 hypothetical protein BASA61_008582 [Batrachochytrium salamandrivorans]KAH6600466.1 hypothetical protein BASA50_002288 [Batrachochytrium salamandrivorans]KAH9270766.1 hypothetical protein BASA83_007128 [Batrachochytrium salamandrivorans]